MNKKIVVGLAILGGIIVIASYQIYDYFEVIVPPTTTTEFDGMYDLKIGFGKFEKYVLIGGITIYDGKISSGKIVHPFTGDFGNKEFYGFVEVGGKVNLNGPCYHFPHEKFGGNGFYSIDTFDENKIAQGVWSCTDDLSNEWILSPTGGNIEGFTPLYPFLEN